MKEQVKTSFMLPKALYVELKKRAAEEGRTVREILIEAIVNYLNKTATNERSRSKLMELLLSPSEGAGPEDFKEYEYEDVGE